MSTKSGIWKNNLYGEMLYQSFLPNKLSSDIVKDMALEDMNLLIEANIQLAFLKGMTSQIPSIPLFVSMYIRKEALLSSQIEGTQATLEDILSPITETNINKDVSDVITILKLLNML